jgi:O-antigen ligase
MRGIPRYTAATRQVAADAPRARRAGLLDRALVVCFMLLLYGLFGSSDGSARSQAIWIVSYVITGYGLWVERRRVRAKLAGAAPVVALVALLLFSPAWSEFHDISLKRALELVGTSASAYLLVCRLELEEFLLSLCCAAGAAALLSLFAVVAAPAKGVMHEEYAGAWMGIFVHKNSLGQAMAMGAITALALALTADFPRSLRLWLAAAAGVCCLLLLGSQSATSVVMFGLMAAALALFALRRFPLGRRVAPFAATGVGLGLVLIALNFSAVVSALGRDAKLSGRTDIWPLVIEAIEKRPLLGYGYDTFWLPDGSAAAYLPVLLDWTPFHAHNGLLELALDAGLTGVCLFLVALVLAIRRTSALASRGRELFEVWPFIAVLYFILGNITEANIAKFNGMNWVLFTIAFLYASERESATAPVARSERRERRGSPIPAYVAPHRALRREPE